jgi:hypothetical protein
MPLSCPRCRRAHPDNAAYCGFDGTALRQGIAPAGQFLQEFVFASGRRCRTFDELAQACYADWDAARSLLGDGTFASFFASMGRADLAKLARECQSLRDRDMALSQFLDGLPATASTTTPRLGLNPRRLQIGPLRVGDQQAIPITLKNEGTGQLQGKLQVADGEKWLVLEQETIRTPREQVIRLHVNTRELTVGQNYIGKLIAVTNGGAAELPVKLELQARPFALAPYKGATSPHDLARKMRDNPKPAVELITNGEIAMWFASNGWTYPIVGQPAPGLACVQQYFEELGLAKAPEIRISHERIEQTIQAPECPVVPIVLTSVGRKLVYARAETNMPWLKINNPHVSGQASANLELEIDTSLMDPDKLHIGAVKLIANANQTFIVPVRVTVQPKPGWFTPRRKSELAPAEVAPRPGVQTTIVTPAGASPSEANAAPMAVWVPPLAPAAREAASDAEARFGFTQVLFVGAILGFLSRALLVLPADIYARVLGTTQRAPLPGSLEAWLAPPSAEEGFLRLFVGATWWLGPLVAVWTVARSGGKWLDLGCGLITGVGLGLAGAATVGCLLVLGDTLPRWVLSALAGATLSAPAATLLWIALGVTSWIALGALGAAVLRLLGPVGQGMLRLAAAPLAGVLHALGLENLAKLFEPQRF